MNQTAKRIEAYNNVDDMQTLFFVRLHMKKQIRIHSTVRILSDPTLDIFSTYASIFRAFPNCWSKVLVICY